MKEKTFEELALDESFRMNFGNEEVPMVKVYDVVKLLQQVREATKKESAEITRILWRTDMVEKAISNLPTDRIKIEPVQ